MTTGDPTMQPSQASPIPPEPGPTVVCVLGAPRSGTSLTTRLLNLVGVDLGPEENLRWPVPESPLWECRQIVDLNERILNRLGGDGLDPPLPEAGWERSEDFAAERAEARRLLDDLFTASPLWGWKDPRTCLTLPFWQQLVPDLRYVICLRNPHDAIASTLRHVPMPPEQMLRTWPAYVASALVNTAGAQRMFVSYEEYFADWGSQVDRLAAFAGLSSPSEGTPAGEEIRTLLKERMWHHRSAPAEVLGDPDFASAITPLYLILELLGAAAGSELSGGSAGRAVELSRAVELYAERVLAGLGPVHERCE